MFTIAARIRAAPRSERGISAGMGPTELTPPRRATRDAASYDPTVRKDPIMLPILGSSSIKIIPISARTAGAT